MGLRFMKDRILKYIEKNGYMTLQDAIEYLDIDKNRFAYEILRLRNEGYKIVYEDHKYMIIDHELDKQARHNQMTLLRVKRKREKLKMFFELMEEKYEPGDIVTIPQRTKYGEEKILSRRKEAKVIKDYGKHVLVEIQEGKATYKESFSKMEVRRKDEE